ncbi:MAG: hypothetical protein K1X71_14910 [Pirellulales bacterium]|nr:hypothetical protein [Pirellulales bacterium]
MFPQSRSFSAYLTIFALTALAQAHAGGWGGFGNYGGGGGGGGGNVGRFMQRYSAQPAQSASPVGAQQYRGQFNTNMQSRVGKILTQPSLQSQVGKIVSQPATQSRFLDRIGAQVKNLQGGVVTPGGAATPTPNNLSAPNRMERVLRGGLGNVMKGSLPTFTPDQIKTLPNDANPSTQVPTPPIGPITKVPPWTDKSPLDSKTKVEIPRPLPSSPNGPFDPKPGKWNDRIIDKVKFPFPDSATPGTPAPGSGTPAPGTPAPGGGTPAPAPSPMPTGPILLPIIIGGGGWGGSRGGYGGRVIYSQPATVVAAPTVQQPATLPDVKPGVISLVEAGATTSGPRYQVVVRNAGTAATPRGFTVALVATGADGQPTAVSPRAIGQLGAMASGETKSLELRFDAPLGAAQTHLVLAVDALSEITESDEADNVTTITRPVEPIVTPAAGTLPAISRVRAGEEGSMIVEGERFGDQAGQLVLELGSVRLALETTSWNARSIGVKLPRLQAPGVMTRLVVYGADGAASAPFDLPAAEPSAVAKN